MIKAVSYFCFFFVLSSAALACGSASNTPEKMALRQAKAFHYYDQNKNGRVTLGEFMLTETKNKQSKHVNVHPFINSDKDKSGDVSFDEWQTFRDIKSYMTKGGC